ncbi:MAG: hypothetical protein ACFFB0_11335 [Promethearchaeota archaeon]
MIVILCKKYGYSIENKQSGLYYCPQCQKQDKVIKFKVFCGTKPSELYDGN